MWLPFIALLLEAFLAVSGQNFGGFQSWTPQEWIFVGSENPQAFQQVPSFQQQQQFGVQQPMFVLIETQPQPQFRQPQPQFQQQTIFQQQPFQQSSFVPRTQAVPVPPQPNRFIPQSQASTRQRVNQEPFGNQLLRRDLPIVSSQQKPSEVQFRTTRRPAPPHRSLVTTRKVFRGQPNRTRRPRPTPPPPPPQFLPPEPLRDVLNAISMSVRTKITSRPVARTQTAPMGTTQMPTSTIKTASRKPTTTIAAPITAKQLTSSHLHLDANDVFLRCCQQHKVDAVCESRCNFEVLSKKVLTGMFLGSDPCPQSNGRDLLTCAAQEMDHTDCCRARGVASTSAGDKCLGFCQMSPGSQFQADVSMLPCWAVLKEIKQCFKDALVTNNR